MNKNQLLKSLIASACLLLSACTGGGGTILEGGRCGLNKPFTMDVNPNQSKLDLNLAPTTLAAGTYERTKVDLYYEELLPSSTENYRLWIQEKKKSDFAKDPKPNGGSADPNMRTFAVQAVPPATRSEDPFETKKICQRNALNMPSDLNVHVNAVTKMVVDQNATVSSTVTEYGFYLDDRKMLVAESVPKPNEKPSLPGNIYEGATEKFLLKLNDTDYEIRSTGNVLNSQGAIRGHYYLSVTYHRQ